jgi:hypothetical protein
VSDLLTHFISFCRSRHRRQSKKPQLRIESSTRHDPRKGHSFRRMRLINLRVESSRTACKISLELSILTPFEIAEV